MLALRYLFAIIAYLESLHLMPFLSELHRHAQVLLDRLAAPHYEMHAGASDDSSAAADYASSAADYSSAAAADSSSADATAGTSAVYQEEATPQACRFQLLLLQTVRGPLPLQCRSSHDSGSARCSACPPPQPAP